MKITGYDVYNHSCNTTQTIDLEDEAEYTLAQINRKQEELQQQHQSEKPKAKIEVFVHYKRRMIK